MPILDLSQILPSLWSKLIQSKWSWPWPYRGGEEMRNLDISNVSMEVIDNSITFSNKNQETPTFIKAHPVENNGNTEVKSTVTREVTDSYTYTTKTTKGIKRSSTDSAKASMKIGDFGGELGISETVESTFGEETSDSSTHTEKSSDTINFSIPAHSTVNLLEVHEIQETTANYKVNIKISGKAKWVSVFPPMFGAFSAPSVGIAEMDIGTLLEFAPDLFSKDPQDSNSYLFSAEGVLQYSIETVKWVVQPEKLSLNKKVTIPNIVETKKEDENTTLHYYDSKESIKVREFLHLSEISKQALNKNSLISSENKKLVSLKRSWPVNPLTMLLAPYLVYLRNQSSAKKLPYAIRCAVGKHYKQDIDVVRYYENVNTVHGAAITFGNEIFFPKKIDLENNNPDGMFWLLHELEHVDQYKDAGGIEPFLWKYFGNSILVMLRDHNFNLHDNNELEKKANEKRDSIFSIVMTDLKKGLAWKLDSTDQFLVLRSKNQEKRQDKIIAINLLEPTIGLIKGIDGGWSYGALSLSWRGDNWINSPGHSGNEGWHLGEGDQFFVADINGDGRQEIIVFSGNGKWIGILYEIENELRAGWITSGWINSPGHSGNEGWHLGEGDRFFIADINGDGRQEIIVFSGNGKWIGVLQENNGGLCASWITKDLVGVSGWQWPLDKDDRFFVADINNDGCEEIIIYRADGKSLGILCKDTNSSLKTSWISHDQILGLWQLDKNDRLFVADINGDSRKEIVVVSSNSKSIGILHESLGVLRSDWRADNCLYETSSKNTRSPFHDLSNENTHLSIENKSLKKSKGIMTDFFNKKVTLQPGKNTIDLSEEDLKTIRKEVPECKIQ